MNTVRQLFLPATLALLTLAGCSNGPHPGQIHASGHIEATEIRVAPKVGGLVLEAPLQEGAVVRAGDLVARLDTSDSEHQLAAARAELDIASARLALLLEGTRVEDVRRAEEHLEQARIELDAAERDLQRLEGLLSNGSATTKARDDARTRHDVAQRAFAAARTELDKLIAGPRHQEVEIARAQRRAAEARVDAIRQTITDATVLAPREAVVTTRVTEPGEIVAPGSVVAVLTDVRHPWLTVWIDEPSLASVRLGQSVEVSVDGLDDDLEGTVSFISPVAEFTPKNVQTPEERAKLVFRIKIALDGSTGVLKPGMPADAYLPRATTASADNPASQLPSPVEST